MVRRLVHHFRRELIAYLALFLALGGTSYATWLAPPNSVNSQAIIDGQVTTADLAPNAIRADEYCILGSCAGSKEIANHAVSSSEIAGGAVGPSQLARGAVGNGQLAANAVTGEKVMGGSLTGADLAAKSVTSRQIDEQSLAQGHAYSAYHDAQLRIAGGDVNRHVLDLNLPAGTYLVLGKVIANIGQPYAGLGCTTHGANTSDAAAFSAESDTLTGTLTMTTVASGSSPFTVQMDCFTASTDQYVSNAKLIAVSLVSNRVSAQ